jgi:hypothetical protein
MNVDGLTERVARLEEADTLLECSKRAQRRVGIRGGVIRNIVLDVQRESRSLLDYVDPFSDIDCVVDRREDWIPLSSALASSLPYAGFYRWEIQTLEYIRNRIRNYSAMPSERVITWFDGSQEGRRIYGEYLGEPLETEQQLESLESTPLNPEADVSLWGHLLMSLRQIRVAYQFESGFRTDRLRFRFERAGFPEVPPDPITVERLRILLAHIAVTSIDLPAAIDELRKLDESTHRAILRYGGQIGLMLLSSDIDESRQITAAIYEDNQRNRNVNIQMQSGDFGTEGLGELQPILPWTMLQSPYRSGCCEYRDFEFGVAVIASRGKKQPTHEQIRAAQILSLTAEDLSENIYPLDRIPLHGLDHFPTPGILSQLPRSTVLRIDHSFPGAYLHRSLPILVGALAPKAER